MTQEWTPERTGALIALWNDRITAREIGRRLGMTRNAVIGKVFRLDLAKRRASVPPPSDDKKVIQLAGLETGMCRWPLDETEGVGFHFCGAAVVEGKPYCPTHCDLAYRSTAKGQRSAAVG